MTAIENPDRNPVEIPAHCLSSFEGRKTQINPDTLCIAMNHIKEFHTFFSVFFTAH